MTMRVLVTTPTGHIGSRVIHRLTGRADISVLARDASKVSASNVTVHTGALEDAAALTRAAAGVQAMLFIIPPTYSTTDWGAWMHQIAVSAAQAIRASEVSRVVMVSSFGAQLPDLGPITLLGKEEQVIRAAAPNLTILRAGAFMENLLQSVPTVRDQSTIYGVYAPDTLLPMIATHDIADVAAARLLDATWTGQSIRGLQGPADISYPDAARAIGAALNRQVNYVQAPVEVAMAGMRAAGMSEAVVKGYGAMLRGLATLGYKAAAEPRSPETTTPTTIDEFARAIFAPALQQAEAVNA
jgi:uncharacterized protein YbjT (DUF2867 family)